MIIYYYIYCTKGWFDNTKTENRDRNSQKRKHRPRSFNWIDAFWNWKKNKISFKKIFLLKNHFYFLKYLRHFYQFILYLSHNKMNKYDQKNLKYTTNNNTNSIVSKNNR